MSILMYCIIIGLLIFNLYLVIKIYKSNKQTDLTLDTSDIVKTSEILNVIFNKTQVEIIFRDEECNVWNSANCHVGRISNSDDEVLIIDLIK